MYTTKIQSAGFSLLLAVSMCAAAAPAYCETCMTDSLMMVYEPVALAPEKHKVAKKPVVAKKKTVVAASKTNSRVEASNAVTVKPNESDVSGTKISHASN